MDNVKFYYITKNARQTSFDGHDFIAPVVDGEIHIVYQETNLCGESRLKGKKSLGAGKNPVTAAKRPAGKMCAKCVELYKANGQLDWGRWEKMVHEAG